MMNARFVPSFLILVCLARVSAVSADLERPATPLEQPASPEIAAVPPQKEALPRTKALFFQLLAAHGDWYETDRHGFAWRPRRAIVEPEWRPYADGRWQWTDYGWTWQSAEPFGWAVYHYGRWVRDAAVGWLWIPGHEWSPGWVSWRAKGNEFLGWAPLPPGAGNSYGRGVDRELEIPPANYAFLSARHFDEPTYLYKFEDPHRVMEMLRSSRNVTRLEQRPGMAVHPMVAGGPDPAMISSFIWRDRDDPDLQPVPLLDLVFAPALPEGHMGDMIQDGKMVLYAPALEAGGDVKPPKVMQGKLRLAARDHGWVATAHEQQGEWRAQLAREAHIAAAEARAAEQRRRQPPVLTNQVGSAPKPAAPVRQTPAAAPVRRSPLNPASLQPSRGLFDRR